MTTRPIMNPVRPGGVGIGVGTPGKPKPEVKLPTATKLKNVLGAWKFQSPNKEIPWKDKKPAGAVIGSVVMQAAPKTQPGQEITAFASRHHHEPDLALVPQAEVLRPRLDDRDPEVSPSTFRRRRMSRSTL